ncbi:MAG: ATP-binding protein [Bacteroidota bacterium]
MDRLISISNELIKKTPLYFKRYLMDEIDWNLRLIGISGARGSGKTTLMMQYLKSEIDNLDEAIYISLDDLYFTQTNLLDFVFEFRRNGGKYIFIDEVHKYQNWSQELKNIYDQFPDVKVVFSGSSALDIYKGSHDLSRRAMVYNLYGLSFREYLKFYRNIELPAYTLNDLLSISNQKISSLTSDFLPVPVFKEYLKWGYYPFFKDSSNVTTYYSQLINILNTTLDSDLPSIFHINYDSILKVKKLLAIIAGIVPYQPNITKLAEQTGTSRDSLLKFLNYLEKSNIIKMLHKDAIGLTKMNKPEKLFLQNPNLLYAFSNDSPDTGNLRETFFLSQLMVSHEVSFADRGDFTVDNKYTFEVGGRKKPRKQIQGIKNAFIVSDEIDYRSQNKLPLWIFGLMY